MDNHTPSQETFTFLYFHNNLVLQFRDCHEEHIIDKAILQPYGVAPNNEFNLSPTVPSFINQAKNRNKLNDMYKARRNNMITMNYLIAKAGYIVNFLKHIEKKHGSDICANVIQDYKTKFPFIQDIDLSAPKITFQLLSQEEVDMFYAVHTLTPVAMNNLVAVNSNGFTVSPPLKTKLQLLKQQSVLFQEHASSPDDEWVYYHIDFLVGGPKNKVIESFDQRTWDNWRNLLGLQ
jgi:hypothetical protein